MASTRTFKRTAAVVVSSCLAACSLTLDLAHIRDAGGSRDASGQGDARFDVTPEDTDPEDARLDDTHRLDAPPMDVPAPDRVVVDVRPMDADPRNCVTGAACPPDQTCCEASGQCYSSACLSCCMVAVEAGMADGGRPDVPRVDAGAADATRTDVGVGDVGASDVGASDVGADAMRDARPGVDAPSLEAGFSCAPACASGQTCCGGVCVDMNVNEHHCGGCSVMCASDTLVCSRGLCTTCGANRACRDLSGQGCCTVSPTAPCPSVCPLGG